MSLTVLITGSRFLEDKELVWGELDNLNPKPTLVVHGGQRGADWWAAEWARAHRVPCVAYPVNTPLGWRRYGKAAGMRRNKLMLHDAKPALVLAFPMLDSVGTWGMVDLAKKEGLQVLIRWRS